MVIKTDKFTRLYALIGVLFGFLFPLFSWFFDAVMHNHTFSYKTIITLHVQNPLHYVIDTAPLFLGLFAAYAGYRQDVINRLNKKLELRVDERGKELSKIAGEFKEIESEKVSIESGFSRANTDLARFSQIIAHDLKAPLVAINNLSEWIEDEMKESLNSETKAQFKLLRTRVYRMNTLLESINEYFAVSSINSKTTEVNLIALLQEVFEKVKIPEASLKLTSAVEVVKLNKRHFTKVFYELMENAILHNSNAEKRIAIDIQRKEDMLICQVQDNGIGIDARYTEDAFTLLKTLESRDKRDSAGVGLAIVKRIIELNSAEIKLKSKPLQGSVFTIKWPLQKRY